MQNTQQQKQLRSQCYVIIASIYWLLLAGHYGKLHALFYQIFTQQSYEVGSLYTSLRKLSEEIQWI